MTAIPLPLTARVGAWFAKNGLRLIAYVLLALVVGIGTLVIYGVQRRTALRNDIASLTTSVNLLKNANETNQRTIAQMKHDRELDDAVILALAEKLKAIDNADAEQTKRIRTLETNNAEVRAWLRTRTPAGVGCVLDDSCAGEDRNGAAPAKQKPAAKVR